MKITVFLIGILALAFLGGFSLVFLLLNYDPFQASGLIIASVYAVLFFSATGVFILIGSLIKKIQTGRALSWQDMGNGLFYSVFFALALVGGLVVLANL